MSHALHRRNFQHSTWEQAGIPFLPTGNFPCSQPSQKMKIMRLCTNHLTPPHVLLLLCIFLLSLLAPAPSPTLAGPCLAKGLGRDEQSSHMPRGPQRGSVSCSNVQRRPHARVEGCKTLTCASWADGESFMARNLCLVGLRKWGLDGCR